MTRLVGDPALATYIVSPPKVRKLPDTTSGEFLARTVEAFAPSEEDGATIFSAIVATDAPVARRDRKGMYLEVLDPAGLELARGADVPLLTDHKKSARETVGRAYDFAVNGNSVSASLRLGLAEDIAPLAARVRDGTLKHVSAGYQVLSWREGTDAEGNRTKTATRWRILEVSLTPIPADPNATIQRSLSMPFETEEIREEFVENIRSACGLSEDWAEGLDVEADEEAIREAARAEMMKRQAPRIRVTRERDNPVEIQTRAADALAFRMTGGDLPEASREYVGMSFVDHAKESLARSGISVRGMTADEILQRSTVGTSDFPLVVSNAMGKVAAQAYQAAESPLKALARQRTLSNFKKSTAIRLGEMGRLEEMTEHGEFKHTSRAESGESMALKTFGRAINVSRKLIIDDDLGLLGDMTSAMGQAAAQTEAEELVALLTANPDLSDETPVFDASRNNTVAVALSENALSDARQHLRTVKGLDGKTIIAVKPRYLVVGPELETAGEKLLASIYAATADDVNAFAGKLSLVVEPRIEDDAWFVMADPASVPSIQYGYLASAQGVQIQRQEAWESLGLKYRAFLDFGCGWLDWRGAYRSTGA
ncbi:prohead protease/major capsid protein fusion protein [Martelella radicis]|uniref:HK97 family phage prohead protease n=1 Tax=Martelella radicis TaxID=1397476 RepID=A0A7W6KFN6_9HYPH|nr:prohead protease/major capsid protein fusion protein [Martelella radicis]MBB4120210.1 HK97 family phage prohead protease [Martelella radicis]